MSPNSYMVGFYWAFLFLLQSESRSCTEDGADLQSDSVSCFCSYARPRRRRPWYMASESDSLSPTGSRLPGLLLLCVNPGVVMVHGANDQTLQLWLVAEILILVNVLNVSVFSDFAQCTANPQPYNPPHPAQIPADPQTTHGHHPHSCANHPPPRHPVRARLAS